MLAGTAKAPRSNYYSRSYDPTIGQFLTEDPTVFEAGDTNLRRYVANTPLIATDPNGLKKTNFADYTAGPHVTEATGLQFVIAFDVDPAGQNFFQYVVYELVGKNAKGQEIGRSKSFIIDLTPQNPNNIVFDTHKGTLASDIKLFEQSGEKVCTVEETQRRHFMFIKSLTYDINGKRINWDGKTQGQVFVRKVVTVKGKDPSETFAGGLQNALHFMPANVSISGRIDVKATYDVIQRTASFSIKAKTMVGTFDVSDLSLSSNNYSY